jgi:DMSO/TMAO reductase YedYZ molybdopterin-dependent catalytic subunit
MSITLQLSELEFRALSGLIDAGVRGTGLRSVVEAAAILQKMETALAKAAKAAKAAQMTLEQEPA